MDDDEIVSRLTQGDDEAAGRFVSKFQPRVQRAVLAAGIRYAEAEDLTQDILIEALRQLRDGRFEGRSALGSWVGTITKGRIVDYWRSSGRRAQDKHVSLEVGESMGLEFVTPAAQEARILVEEVLALMSARHRLAILAHCRSGVSVEELASWFGLSVKRTRTVITDAKKMFRRLIRDGEKVPASRRLKE